MALMRISGGKWRGRGVRAPAGRTRPTQDMVRQALFSMLSGRVAGAAFLDLFAGSGAVGLDAASRGASRVCWVEADRGAMRVLRANVEALCGAPGAPAAGPRECETAIVCADAFRFLESCERAAFDIVFADPPYDRGGGDSRGGRLLSAVAPALKPGGVFVLEHYIRDAFPEAGGWELQRRKTYGETVLSFFELPR